MKTSKPKPLTRKRCLCDWCVRISPMIKRIKNALPDPLKKDFEHLVVRMMCAEEERDVAELKLRGEWDGWEWVKEARQQAETATT